MGHNLSVICIKPLNKRKKRVTLSAEIINKYIQSSLIVYLILCQKSPQTRPRSGLFPPTDPSPWRKERSDLERNAAQQPPSAGGPNFHPLWRQQLLRFSSVGCRWWRWCCYSTLNQTRWPSVCEDRLPANFSAAARRLSAALKAAAGPLASDRAVESPPSPTAGLGPIVLPWRRWR